LTAEGATEPPIRRRSPSIAAFLSFLWPGLGHAYTHRTRAALLFAVPVVLIVLIVLFQAASGLGKLATLIISPSSALTVFILVVLLGIWRELAVIDAASAIPPRGSWRRGRSLVTIGLITVIIGVTHVWAGAVAWALYDASRNVFVGLEGPDAGTPVASAAAVGPIASGIASVPPDDEYVAAPFATPPTAAARINILLTGVDSAETRSHALNDTLIVASIDPTSGNVALISFPRDISNFPMVGGGTYKGKINSYMTWVNNHPEDFRDKPLVELVKELSFLVGAPIHYYAAVDLAGFRRLIDAAGGVTINNQREINDPRYDWLDGRPRGFKLSVGKHKLDGDDALAYVRSRYTFGDNDFNRARRQQEVLVALANSLTNPTVLPRLPSLIEAAGKTVRTNFPSGRVGEMLELLQGRAGQKVKQVVLGPPYAYHPPNDQTGGIYTLRLRMDRLAKLSREIFGSESTYPAPTAINPQPTAAPAITTP
jgi:polyisoprenyl-teichoic acid--peptidoglycan teichoic acid transferase